MKRIIFVVVIVAVVILGAFLLAGCGDLTQKGEKTVTILVVDGGGDVVFLKEVKTEELYLAGVLGEVEGVDFDIAGGFINYVTVGGVSYGAGGNEWVAIYTSSAHNRLIMPEWGTIEVEGATYASAALGLADMPLRRGYVYVFAVREF